MNVRDNLMIDGNVIERKIEQNWKLQEHHLGGSYALHNILL